MKIICIDRGGNRHELDAIEGWQVMEILRDHGMAIRAECGGACACATCHVYVHPDWLDKLYPRQEEESYMLDEAFMVQENSRLSCQLIFTAELDGLVVTLAPDSL